MAYRAKYLTKFSKIVGLQKGKGNGRGVLTLNRMYIGKSVRVSRPDGECLEMVVASRKKAWKRDGKKRPEQGLLYFHHSWVGQEAEIEVLDK